MDSFIHSFWQFWLLQKCPAFLIIKKGCSFHSRDCLHHTIIPVSWRKTRSFFWGCFSFASYKTLGTPVFRCVCVCVCVHGKALPLFPSLLSRRGLIEGFAPPSLWWWLSDSYCQRDNYTSPFSLWNKLVKNCLCSAISVEKVRATGIYGVTI